MNAWLVIRARTAENEQIERANTNLARAVSQQIDSTVALAEHIISGIVFELERADITPETLQRLQPVLVNHASEVQAIKGLFIYDEEGRWLKIPQTGRVVIEDDVEIGANTTIDRATLGETRIGEGTKIWHFCHVMPGARIGRRRSAGGCSGRAPRSASSRKARTACSRTR